MKQRLTRRHLYYYLEVYDRVNGQLLGHLVDITGEGIKLVADRHFPIGETYRMRMACPKDGDKEEMLLFDGKSLWTGDDVNKENKVTGFEFINPSEHLKKHIALIVEEIGFNE